MGAGSGPDELELVAVEGRCRLRLRVKAGAHRTAILGVHDGALKISVTTAPEKGKANRTVLQLLAERLGIPRSSIEIVSGATSPDKTVVVPLRSRVVRERLGRGQSGIIGT